MMERGTGECPKTRDFYIFIYLICIYIEPKLLEHWGPAGGQ